MPGNRPQPFDLSGAPSDDFALEPRAAVEAEDRRPAASGDDADLPPLALAPADGAPMADRPRAWPIYLAAALVSALWAAAPALYALSNQRADAFTLVVLGALAI